MCHVRRYGPIVAAVALAGYWAIWALAAERVFGEPSVLRPFIFNDAFFALGVLGAVAVGAYAGRWWILGVATTPLAVWAGLDLSGHVAPYHESTPALAGLNESSAWLLFSVLYVAPLALGVLVRKAGVSTSGARRPGRA